jgi:predicted ATP-grasp superfamily ATP-dependent carboligase
MRPEITLDTFRGRDGRSRTVCRERLEVKAGVCTKARLFEDEVLADLGRRVAEGLDIRGSFCMQMMQNPQSNGWEITDVNCRPGAGTRLSAAAGVDVLSAWFADRWGEDPARFLRPLSRECFVVRSYQEWVH